MVATREKGSEEMRGGNVMGMRRRRPSRDDGRVNHEGDRVTMLRARKYRETGEGDQRWG